MGVLSRIRNRASSVLAFLALGWILYIYFDDLPGFRAVRGYSRLRHNLQLLNDTGVGEWRRRSWESDATYIQAFEEEHWDKAVGGWSGEWVRYTGDLSPAEQMRAENQATDVAGNEGSVTLKFREMAGLEMLFASHDVEYDLGLGEFSLDRGARPVREAVAIITIQDENRGEEGVHLDVYGTHWPRVGAFLLKSTSKDFAGVIGLPHLSHNWDYFTTKNLLSSTVGKTTEGKKAITFGEGNSRKAILDTNQNVPSCQYTTFIQMHPVEKQNMRIIISEVESVPNCGDRSTPMENTASPLSIVNFSPDCGFILETKGHRLDFSLASKMYFECKEQET